jgi:hypothetical protein
MKTRTLKYPANSVLYLEGRKLRALIESLNAVPPSAQVEKVRRIVADNLGRFAN